MWLICFSSRRKAPAFCQGIFHSSLAKLFWEPAVALGLILSNRQCDQHSQLLRDIWGWLEKLVVFFFLLKTRVCSLKVEFVVENRSFFFANGSLFLKIRVWKSYFVLKNLSLFSKIGVWKSAVCKSEFENRILTIEIHLSFGTRMCGKVVWRGKLLSRCLTDSFTRKYSIYRLIILL